MHHCHLACALNINVIIRGRFKALDSPDEHHPIDLPSLQASPPGQNSPESAPLPSPHHHGAEATGRKNRSCFATASILAPEASIKGAP